MASLASWAAVRVAVVPVSHTGLKCASVSGSNARPWADSGKLYYHGEHGGTQGTAPGIFMIMAGSEIVSKLNIFDVQASWRRS